MLVMSKGKDAWNTKENAEAYDAYARNFPMYQDTSRDLVAISGIKLGMTVVDLAAGTGTTTQAILDKTNGNVCIIAVDQAEEMLKKAREKFVGQSVQFIVSEAEDLDTAIRESVDTILCNSAFWQMKAQKVFRSVSHILKPDGVFAFNLPDHFFSYPDFQTQPRTPSPYNLDNLVSWGKEVGLTLVTKSVETYSKSADEMIAFNEIPVMKRNFKTEDDRKKYIAALQESRTENTLKRRQWVYFVFQKR